MMEKRVMPTTGTENSLLGFGCMRFPTKDGKIDYERSAKMIDMAYNAGVTYYDVAYPYHGGEAEPVLGKILKKYDRSTFHLATKLPCWEVHSLDDAKRLFAYQLERLQVDYVDYYLLHALDINRFREMVSYGVPEYLAELKEQGKIRNLGFSFHDKYESFVEIINYRDWDFCQIQYNYIDEVTQAGVKGLKAAAEKGIPVIIMEPLRGGKLVDIPNNAKTVLTQSPRKWTAPELALRWLWNQKEVSCVLSGMNSLEMIEENCRIASDVNVDEFTQEDFELTKRVKDIIQSKTKVGCTGCRYCMPCPKNVDIPSIFASYNSMYTESRVSALADFIRVMALRKDSAFADQCIGCGKCEQHCPQHIEIRKQLKMADKKLRPWYIRIGIFFMQKFFTPNRK